MCQKCTEYGQMRNSLPRNKAIQRASFLRLTYGLTVKQWDDMHTAQGGACAICGTVPQTTLHVDHDHDTGRVRGLLCANCNKALGLLSDSKPRLLAAAAYLDEDR